eukprot:sb/3461638/
MTHRRSRRLAQQVTKPVEGVTHSEDKENVMPKKAMNKPTKTRKRSTRKLIHEEEGVVPIKKRRLTVIQEEVKSEPGESDDDNDDFLAVSEGVLLKDRQSLPLLLYLTLNVVEEDEGKMEEVEACSPGKKSSVMEMLMACETADITSNPSVVDIKEEVSPSRKRACRKEPAKKTKVMVPKQRKQSDSDQDFVPVKTPVTKRKLKVKKESPPSDESGKEEVKPVKKKGKKKVPELTEEEKEVRRFTNRCVKERDSCIEQCTLTLGIARMRHAMTKLQSPLIQSLLMSVLPELPQSQDLEISLNRVVSWFHNTYTLDDKGFASTEKQLFSVSLLNLQSTYTTPYLNTYVSLFCSALLTLGYDARLVQSMIVPSLDKVEKKRVTTPVKHLRIPEWWVEVRHNDLLYAVDVVNEVVSVDYFREKIFLNHPGYIVAMTTELVVLDSTAKYVLKWAEIHRKARTLHWEWWDEQVIGKQQEVVVVKEHEKLMKEIMLERGFPSSLGGFKNNLVYALERDLLKVEALYPSQPNVLGTFKNHPVYPRECVRTLKQIILILKEGRQLKAGEVPYKVVKQKILYDRYPGDDRWKDLPLYGEWQTQWFQPPTAVDGKVPRNEYGNVDLYQPWMLPIGTVHVDLPGSYALARRLGMDAAHAVIGFEFPRCRAVPVTSGVVVVGEENGETLRAAWQEHSQNQAVKVEEKRQKRIWDNWRMLIKGLLIKERIIARYDMGVEEGGPKGKKGKGKKKGGSGHVHVFPARSQRKDKVTGQMVQKCSCGLVVPVESCEEELGYDQGWVALQQVIDRSIMLSLNMTESDIPVMSIRQMPYPAWTEDGFANAIRNSLPLMLVISFLWIGASIRANYLTYTNAVILYIFLLEYAISIMCFCFFLSGQRYSSCLLSSTCMGYGANIISKWETMKEGLQFDNVGKQTSDLDLFTFGDVMLMIFVDIVVYSLLTWRAGMHKNTRKNSSIQHYNCLAPPTRSERTVARSD